MNKLLIEVSDDGLCCIVVNNGECDIHIADTDMNGALMLMSAGAKLKQSEKAGEFLAQFLDGE